ncbi:MAG: TfoX/Sxy family protein [Nitrospinota bacterium]
MVKRDTFLEFAMEQLSRLGGVTGRAMFGGYGLYKGGKFFGIVHKKRLYFKTDDKTGALYVERGMKPFAPNKKQTLKTYYEVPSEIIEDGGELAEWAKKAVRCQVANKGRGKKR